MNYYIPYLVIYLLPKNNKPKQIIISLNKPKISMLVKKVNTFSETEGIKE